MVEIARAFTVTDAKLRLVILDEPTAALGVAQTEQVLALVRRLGEFDSAREALNALIEVREHDRYLVALSSLSQSELLHAR